MKQLSKIQSALFLLGGVLMVVGACSFVLKQIYPSLVETTSWVFLLGTVLFSVIQSMQTYEGKSTVIHRLKRIQNVANILFVLCRHLDGGYGLYLYREMVGQSRRLYITLSSTASGWW